MIDEVKDCMYTAVSARFVSYVYMKTDFIYTVDCHSLDDGKS